MEAVTPPIRLAHTWWGERPETVQEFRGLLGVIGLCGRQSRQTGP